MYHSRIGRCWYQIKSSLNISTLHQQRRIFKYWSQFIKAKKHEKKSFHFLSLSFRKYRFNACEK